MKALLPFCTTLWLPFLPLYVLSIIKLVGCRVVVSTLNQSVVRHTGQSYHTACKMQTACSKVAAEVVSLSHVSAASQTAALTAAAFEYSHLGVLYVSMDIIQLASGRRLWSRSCKSTAWFGVNLLEVLDPHAHR